MPKVAAWDADDWRAFYDERAGVLAADGDLRPRDVEARAFECCVAEWLIRNPVRSDPGRCQACGVFDACDPLLPYGTTESGHTWLHGRCWPAWYQGRKAAAVAALKALGIDVAMEVPR